MKKVDFKITLAAIVVSLCSIQGVWAEDEANSIPLITVDLLEPGSLGTEVLYQTDHVKNVRRLKVRGAMNDDDWAKIKMMSNLLELDMSEALFTSIPARQFQVTSSDTVMQHLQSVKLPEGLLSIGEYAFYYSNVESLLLPSTVTSVGSCAFEYSHIKELYMPDNMTDFGSLTFSSMSDLTTVVLPKNLEVVPEASFRWCENLTTVVLPENLKWISASAFSRCSSLSDISFPEGLEGIGDNAFSYTSIHASLPNSLTSIGSYAFQSCDYESIVVPQNVSWLGQYAFVDCDKLKYAELGTQQYALNQWIFEGCNSLETLRLNSPTVVTANSQYPPIRDWKVPELTLIVPDFLVNSYKLDSYWYNCKAIEPFSTSEIQDWFINNPLVLNHDRLNGSPNITVVGSKDRLPSLKINGDATQNINNLILGGNSNSFVNYPGQILSNCDHVQVSGDVRVDLETAAKYWYFFSLPYDIKISDIIHGADNTQFAIRYYDGANRAANGATGSWKNYSQDDVIPAGTGFIFQTNKDTWNGFYALAGASKQNIVANTEFTKTLEVNATENTANKGWNLVGNPYQCYYNNHALNFTGPITVWNAQSRTYTAYSLVDDDYAIRPNEAFFVQCPSAELNTISFPLQGRQLTATIESQNAAKARTVTEQTRQLIDIQIYDAQFSDQTRIVLNEQAKCDYELDCDASKFLSADAESAQIYTLGTDGTEYAINERPAADGTVQLGLYATKAGQYTLTMPRCDAGAVILTDNYANQTVDLAQQDYAFTTQAGIDEGRFTLQFAGVASAIADIAQQPVRIFGTDGGINLAGWSGTVQVYALDGRLLQTKAVQAEGEIVEMPQGTYVVRANGKAVKVIVK